MAQQCGFGKVTRRHARTKRSADGESGRFRGCGATRQFLDRADILIGRAEQEGLQGMRFGIFDQATGIFRRRLSSADQQGARLCLQASSQRAATPAECAMRLNSKLEQWQGWARQIGVEIGHGQLIRSVRFAEDIIVLSECAECARLIGCGPDNVILPGQEATFDDMALGLEKVFALKPGKSPACLVEEDVSAVQRFRILITL